MIDVDIMFLREVLCVFLGDICIIDKYLLLNWKKIYLENVRLY